MDEEEIRIKLTALYLEWDYIAEHGSVSTVWTDGQALNYIRRKIEIFKQEIETGEALPGIFFHELPPLINGKYMKNADKILLEAEQTLKIYLEDENYRYIEDAYRNIAKSNVFASEAERMYICEPLEELILCVENLKRAVEIKNFIKMKQNLDVKKMQLAFKSCRAEFMEELEGVLPFG